MSEEYIIPDGYRLDSFGSEPLGIVVGIAVQVLMYDNVNQNVEAYLNWAPLDNTNEQTIVLSGDITVDTAIDISSGRVVTPAMRVVPTPYSAGKALPGIYSKFPAMEQRYC